MKNKIFTAIGILIFIILSVTMSIKYVEKKEFYIRGLINEKKENIESALDSLGLEIEKKPVTEDGYAFEYDLEFSNEVLDNKNIKDLVIDGHYDVINPIRADVRLEFSSIDGMSKDDIVDEIWKYSSFINQIAEEELIVKDKIKEEVESLLSGNLKTTASFLEKNIIDYNFDYIEASSDTEDDEYRVVIYVFPDDN